MSALSACPYPVLSGAVMSNYGHEIDPVAASMLKDEEVALHYAGWDFNGQVWWDRDAGTYRCEVWVYHIPQEVVSGTLQEIMDTVSAGYGEG